MKRLSIVFWGLAILLSHLMCAVAAFHYCDMLWGIRFAGCSAPAWTGLLAALPYAAGVLVCVTLALIFQKKAKGYPRP